jgi:ubiquitin carboxyl-terminal hydrolase 8
MSTTSFGTSLSSYGSPSSMVSPPPQASLNPFHLSRRRSDIMDQSEHAMLSTRPSIDYPDLSARHVVRPPPAAATPPLERQDNRPRIPSHVHAFPASPAPLTIQSDYPVTYWADMQVATSGLKNLGNTCYMNATIQCLSATIPFSRFFTGKWGCTL